MWDSELEIAKSAALDAGNAIMEIYESGDFGIESKADNSPLTLADRVSNDIIIRRLQDEFPDYAVLSEEIQDNRDRLENDNCFVIDPLDGTKEFIKKNGQFTVNIALVHKHRTVMGVIYVPVTGELYYASENFGAYYMSKDGIAKRICVTDRMEQLRMVMSGSHGSSLEKALILSHSIAECIRMGSSLKGCLIAKGDAEVYYRFNPTMEWDTAAMQCIVEEAGGIFRQMDGTPMLYNRENCLNDKGFYAINREENIFV